MNPMKVKQNENRMNRHKVSNTNGYESCDISCAVVLAKIPEFLFLTNFLMILLDGMSLKPLNPDKLST